MFVRLIASLFLTNPAPLDMPRAEAFFVQEDGRQRLEDRYDRTELWISQAVVGRWIDDDDRVFTLATLDAEPPSTNAKSTQTREEFAAGRIPMPRIRANHKVPRAFRRAIEILADGCALCEEKPRASRQLPHGYRDVDYWQHPTNYTAVVCAFRREKSEIWHLAVWRLAEEDDYATQVQLFEDQFLRKEFEAVQEDVRRKTEDANRVKSERELLRADVKHSVAAYDSWHFAAAEEFAVIDDLPSREIVIALTNEFATMRARYAAALPTGLDGSNVLSVARLYASRAEYLSALETDGCTNMMWSAAYWSPARRELVAYLPPAGAEELTRTFRHEAFHQYLSYAASLIPVSPWLNEGYAQYFEEPDGGKWDEDIDTSDEGLERLAELLPGILAMDYDRFYEGGDFLRRLKYRLAWSAVQFLERGADKVRFQPFANLKRDYFKELFASRDMQRATAAAFRGPDNLKLFVAEWTKFWQENR